MIKNGKCKNQNEKSEAFAGFFFLSGIGYTSINVKIRMSNIKS
jgi:hypothetical protein